MKLSLLGISGNPKSVMSKCMPVIQVASEQLINIYIHWETLLRPCKQADCKNQLLKAPKYMSLKLLINKLRLYINETDRRDEDLINFY